jgi:hypothetical protein
MLTITDAECEAENKAEIRTSKSSVAVKQLPITMNICFTSELCLGGSLKQ